METCGSRHFGLGHESWPMKRSISAILPFLLITVGCVLLVEALYQVAGRYLFTPAEEIRVAARVPEAKQSAAPLKRTAEDQVRSILARNLFGQVSPTDKDANAKGTAVDDLQATTLDLVLMGTVIGDENESRAIILEKEKKTQEIYRLGEMVQGAVLKEILRGKVVLTYNNKDEVLDMTEAAKYSSQIPAAAAPAARQKQTLPLSAPQQIEPQLQAPDSPPAATQPKVILRPARRANTIMPTKNSQ